MPDAPPIDPSQAQLQLHASVPFGFPVRGINQNWGREQQPPGSTPDCLNVMPYDLTRRARGGQRPGATTTTANASYTPHTTLTNDRFSAIYSFAAESGVGARSNYLMAVIGGKAYLGTTLSSALTACTGTYAAGATPPFAPVCIGAYVYFSDLGTIYRVNVAAATLAAYTIGPGLLQPRILAAWRRRLVAANTSDGNPQNAYFSRVNDPSDWDYGQTDPAAAFALNDTSKSGQVGDPITALCPLSEDLLIIGCDRSLWATEGDPADGGRVFCVNYGVGMVAAQGWCRSPDGDLYFVGTGGFYRMRRGSFLCENLSASNYDSYFHAGFGGSDLILVWDRNRHGCWIFNSVQISTGSHLWYDARTGGLFPQSLPLIMGPSAATEYISAGGSSQIIFGGYHANAGGAGSVKLYTFNDAALTDDGAAISSYAFLGPVRPAGDALRRSRLTSLDLILGEAPSGLANSDMSLIWTLQSANTAIGALTAPVQTATATITSAVGRQATIRARQTASDFFLKLATGGSGKTWSMDEAIARFVRAGRVRT